jgi:hypothetical protein
LQLSLCCYGQLYAPDRSLPIAAEPKWETISGRNVQAIQAAIPELARNNLELWA